MSSRPLTEELRSVLIANSLDAPEPSDTIADVLNRTVASPVVLLIKRRARFKVAGSIVGAAATIGAITLAAVALPSGGGGNKKSASMPAADNAQSQPAERGPGSSTSGAAAGSSAPNSVPGASSAAAGPSVPSVNGSAATTGLGDGLTPIASVPSRSCPPAATDVSESSVASGLTLPGARVVFVQCADGTGAPLAGEVRLYRAATLVSTPIAAARRLQLIGYKVDGDRLTVRAAGIAPVNAALNGAVYDYAFQLAPGTSLTPQNPTVVAPACTATQLAITEAASPTGSAAMAIRLRNRTVTRCVVSGYPDVRVLVHGKLVASAARQLAGPRGGSTSPAMGVVILSGGQTASSLVEAVTKPSADYLCASGISLQVSLGGLGMLSSTNPPLSPVCAPLLVHPLVPGNTGTGP